MTSLSHKLRPRTEVRGSDPGLAGVRGGPHCPPGLRALPALPVTGPRSRRGSSAASSQCPEMASEGAGRSSPLPLAAAATSSAPSAPAAASRPVRRRRGKPGTPALGGCACACALGAGGRGGAVPTARTSRLRLRC